MKNKPNIYILISLIFICIFLILYDHMYNYIYETYSNNTLNIHITDWWDNENDNFVTKAIKLKYPNKNIIFTHDNPDILIYSIFGNEHEKYKNVPARIYYLNEPKNYQSNDKRILNSTQSITWNYKNTKNHIYFNGFSKRLHDLSINRNAFNNIAKYLLIQNKNYLNPFSLLKRPINNENTYFNEKKHFCAFIVSNCDANDRLTFFNRLNNYKKVNSFGKCKNNTNEQKFLKNNFDTSMNFERHMNAFLYRSFKFVICFENSSHPGYLTEKILYAMLANAIPIYWGNPDIGKIFNEKSFINVHNYKSFDDVIKKVTELDQDDDKYKKMLQEPWIKNNKITDSWRNKNGFLTQQEIANQLKLII
jgi:alpha(1,3/1,4) fucosyltransferase